MPKLEMGMEAPLFCLKDQEGRERTLEEFRGRYLVLYIYPKDFTSGCTREAEAFRDRYAEFRARGAEVLGLSPDSVESHAKFVAKLDLPFPLLSDPERTVIDAYGAFREKVSFGKRRLGVVRSTFLIDPEGRIVRAWTNVRVEGHVERVLETLDAHVSSSGETK